MRLPGMPFEFFFPRIEFNELSRCSFEYIKFVTQLLHVKLEAYDFSVYAKGFLFVLFFVFFLLSIVLLLGKGTD